MQNAKCILPFVGDDAHIVPNNPVTKSANGRMWASAPTDRYDPLIGATCLKKSWSVCDLDFLVQSCSPTF